MIFTPKLLEDRADYVHAIAALEEASSHDLIDRDASIERFKVLIANIDEELILA